MGWDELVGLLPGAIAVAIIGYAESATVAESMANEHGYDVEPDRELRATGIANILSGLFQGFITGGGASQSAANDRAGANTQLVSLLVSGLTVVTAVALLPLFRDLPQAALGAVVISAVIGFLDLAALERVRRLRRDSFVIAVAAMLAVLALGVLQGLIVAVVISLAVFLVRASRPSGSVLGRIPGTGAYVALEHAPEARTEPGLLVYRLNAPLLFVNAKRLRDGIRAQVRDADPPVRVVLLDLSFTPSWTSRASTCSPRSATSWTGGGWRCGWPGSVRPWRTCWSAAAWPTPSAVTACTARSRTPPGTPQPEGPVSGPG